MSELYDNLLKATDNTNDITTEKYAIITKINGNICSAKEIDSDLEHSNVPIMNGADLKLGDKVIIGFLNNSIYDIVCYGVLDRTVEINWENVKDKPTVFPTDWENIQEKPSTFPPSSHNHISSEVTDLINTIYPIGSIYMSVNSTSPQTLFGGVWEQLKDRFLLGVGDTYNNGATGGEATHTLNINEMPSHNHTQNAHRHHFSRRNVYLASGKGAGAIGHSTDPSYDDYYTNYQTPTINNTGGGQAHNNMPPYLTVFMWKRTA